MTEMNVAEMKNHKAVVVIKKSQSRPPHLPRQMALIYQVLEDIEEGVRLLKRAVYQRSH